MSELADQIRRVLKGEPAAFNTIVDRFQDMAVGYASTILGDVHLAEDAAQNAFVQAYTNLEAVRDADGFPGWFKRIVFTECMRLKRQVQPEVQDPGLVERILTEEDDPGTALEATERQTRVEELLATLPDRAQGVTILYYLADMPQREIADFLNVSEGTVKKRLHDARKRMRRNVVAGAKLGRASRLSRSFAVGSFVSVVEVIADGDAEKLRSLIRANPSIVNLRGALNFRYNSDSYFAGASLLHFLAGHPTPHNTFPDNALEMLGILLDAGADPNATTNVGHTMLSLICYDVPRKKGLLIDMIDLLISRGADPNEGFGRSAMENSLWHCEVEAAEALYRHGAKIDMRLAAGIGRTDLIESFLNADGSVKPCAFDLAPPMGEGCKRELTDAQVLVEALNMAVLNHQFEAATYLLNRGADINDYGCFLFTREGGLTPLHHACFQGPMRWPGPEMVEFLLDRGADPMVNDIGKPKARPLGWAIQNRRYEVVKFMVERGGCTWNLTDHLCHAASRGEVDVLRVFLDAGAVPWQKQDHDPWKTALQYAEEQGNDQMVQVLLASTKE